jgi:hypothetical protein
MLIIIVVPIAVKKTNQKNVHLFLLYPTKLFFFSQEKRANCLTKQARATWLRNTELESTTFKERETNWEKLNLFSCFWMLWSTFYEFYTIFVYYLYIN